MDEVESLTALAQEQHNQLQAAEEEAHLLFEEDTLFYSVRTNPPKHIDPLKGPKLEVTDILEPSNDTATPTDPLFTAVIAQIDLIEAGTVKGWACSTTTKVPGPLKIEVYVNRIRVAEVIGREGVDLPSAAKTACLGDAGGGAAPALWQAQLPALHPGTHTLRAFVVLPDGKRKVEAHHSPAPFVESTVKPDGVEALRRKDAIILRRNAELVAIWSEVRTQLPWRKTEAAYDAEEAMAKEGKSGGGGESGDDRLLAIVFVHSEPKARDLRELARQTWFPSTPTAREEILKKYKIDVKFIVLAQRVDIRKPLEAENAETQDMLLVEEDSFGSDARKVLSALALTLNRPGGDADYYAVTRDTVIVDFERLHSLLSGRKDKAGNLYMGCLKSGNVVDDEGSVWNEPDQKRFGNREKGVLQYPPHATRTFFALSRFVARHLSRSRAVLHTYKFEDTTFGAWMVGLDVQLIEESKFCCDYSRHCGANRREAQLCAAYSDMSCGGVCKPELNLAKTYEQCVGARFSTV